MTSTGLIGLGFAALVLMANGESAVGAARRGPDFNGDGRADLVVGVQNEGIGDETFAGVVQVIYGTSNGLTSSGDQVWSQDSSGIANSSQQGDKFGASFAWGDFDGDGFDDLAIGVPGETVNGESNAGAVNVIYGSRSGLRASGNQFWTQNTGSVNDTAEAGDGFGTALAAGDFDGDGKDDLAIGVPGEMVSGNAHAGIVQILRGTSHGLTDSGDQVWSEDSEGIADDASANEFFGSELAAGDFDHNGRDDLAIGVKNEDVGVVLAAGAVHVLYGSSHGLRANGSEFLTREDFGATPSDNEHFGERLTTGDFDGTGKDDLAIGTTSADVGGVDRAGEVEVIYGSSHGLNLNNVERWTEGGGNGAKDAGGSISTISAFGYSIAAGDFDGNGRDDLAIGVPNSTINGRHFAGRVRVIYGGSNGLLASTAESWSQDSTGIADKAETSDEFGVAVGTGDFNGDERADLVVGVPFETYEGVGGAGLVHVIYGSSSGLKAIGNQKWGQNTHGIGDSAQPADNFGKLGQNVSID